MSTGGDIVDLAIEIRHNGSHAPSICQQCGGRCCKRVPGMVHPEDVPTYDNLKKLLATKNYVIDYWAGDPRDNKDELGCVYFVRPRTIGDSNSFYTNEWFGTCIFLRPNGCRLEFDKRPAQCRHLTPSRGLCTLDDKTKYDKQAMTIAWIPRQQELKAIVNDL